VTEYVSGVSVYDAASVTVIDEDSPLLETNPRDLAYAAETRRRTAGPRLNRRPDGGRLRAANVVYSVWGPLWTLRPLRRLAEANTALPSGPSGSCAVVHLHDVADAIPFLTSPQPPGRRFFVSGPSSTTWSQFDDCYRAMLLLPRLSLPDSADRVGQGRRFYAASPLVDTSRLAGVGFRSRISLDSGMDHLARWARWAGST
jgi:nucleoside-diphosphate-sugar epimerase